MTTNDALFIDDTMTDELALNIDLGESSFEESKVIDNQLEIIKPSLQNQVIEKY